MEIHHIVPEAEGGEDSEENGIPLCFDCHAEVPAYNPKHPKGRRFTSSELRKHRSQWFSICATAPWSRITSPPGSLIELTLTDQKALENLRVADRSPVQRFAFTIMQKDRATRGAWIRRALELLESEDEDRRWAMAMLVEEFVLWEPRSVPAEALEAMSRDESFSVRSCAAVCYCLLAALDPASVPLDVVMKLARHDEDWYVNTPATNALLRLGRVRPVVIDWLTQNLSAHDAGAREHAAAAISRLAAREPDLLTPESVASMTESGDPVVKEVGTRCQEQQQRKRPWVAPPYYAPFD
jgi:hypothetical protein